MVLKLEVEEALAQRAETVKLICRMLEDVLAILQQSTEIEAQKADKAEIENFLLVMDRALPGKFGTENVNGRTSKQNALGRS